MIWVYQDLGDKADDKGREMQAVNMKKLVSFELFVFGSVCFFL
jgi:hypothetical protein